MKDKQYGSHPDWVVIKKVLAGKHDYFQELVMRYQARVYAMVMRQTGDRELAADLTQEIFFRAYRSLSKFRYDCEFSTWLIRITLNTTSNYFSSKRHRQTRQTSQFDDSVELNSGDNPAVKFEINENAKRIQRLLSTLKPMFRDVITICGLEGHSYEEAAGILGVPVGTVRSRLNKARQLLRPAIQQDENVGVLHGK